MVEGGATDVKKQARRSELRGIEGMTEMESNEHQENKKRFKYKDTKLNSNAIYLANEWKGNKKPQTTITTKHIFISLMAIGKEGILTPSEKATKKHNKWLFCV